MKKQRINKGKMVISLLIAVAILLVISAGAQDGVKSIQARRDEAILRMRSGFESFAPSIDISDLGISPKELGKIFSDATKDTPYLFYVSSSLSYTYRAGGCVVEVKPKYIMEKEEAEAALDFCKAEIDKITYLVQAYDGELERIVAAHDLLCRDFCYDTTLASNNIYSFLKEKRGTCQGYTWAYMAILRELGIECHYVASDEIAHIWLAVKIDGEWYHSDVTWDDPPSAEQGQVYRRAHLLFSDEKADRDGYVERYGGANIKCESTKYDSGEICERMTRCITSGDVDHDGEVSLEDLLTLRYAIEKKPSSALCPLCADTDRDYVLGSDDIERLRGLILDKTE